MPRKNKKLPDYTTRSWNSLSDLKERIERDEVEQIVKFDGASLKTEYRTFGLAFGKLRVVDN